VDPGGRLFVADADNHRVVMFDIASLASGAAASRVLGQPNFNTGTTNTSCGGGGSGDENANACGLGVYGVNVEVDEGNGVLYVADPANHRIAVFDVATVTNGEAATKVLGQLDLTTGYDPSSVSLGGSTARDGLVMPMGLDYDPINDRLIATDSGNHRLMVFGSNVGGEPIAVAGEDESTETTQLPDGSVILGITTAIGHDFSVHLPAGTTPLPGGDITITVDDQVGGNNRPRIRVDAKLPPGQTKTITIPKRWGRTLCVIDKTHAEFTQHPQACAGNQIQGTNTRGQCTNHTVNGDPGDGGDAVLGRHTIRVCLDASGGNYVLSGLLHSMVEEMPDATDDVLDDYGQAGDETYEVGVETGGCDAGGSSAGGGLAALALAALGWALMGRSRSTASSVRSARRSLRRGGRRRR
jgi:hypothetical protein